MNKLIRFLLYVVGAVVALFVILAIVITLLIDPNDYKDEIEQLAADATGRTLTLEGDLSLQLFPCCGVELGALSLSNPEGFEGPHFARVGNAAVSVRLLPLLLRQELLIGDIELDGLDVILISRADGTVNWEFESADEATPEPAVEDEAEGTALAGLGVAGVSVTNGRLLYRDEADSTEIEVGRIELSTGAIEDGEAFDLEAGLEVAGLAEGLVVALALEMNATPDIDAGAATINELEATIKAAGVTTRLGATGAVSADAQDVRGSLRIEEFSPKAVLAAVGEPPIVTADPKALTRYSFTGDWAFDGKKAEVSNIRFTLDDTTGTGWLRLPDIDTSAVRFDLQLDTVDADRYSAPEEEGAGGAAAESSDELDLPVDDLRALDVEGKFAIGELRTGGAKLTNASLKLRAKDGLIAIDPLTADVYGGQFGGLLTLDVRGKTPKLAVKQKLSGFRIGQYLQDTQDLQNLTGEANLAIDATSAGNAMSELTRNLAGNMTLDVKDGKYIGVDLWYEIKKARALIREKQPPAAPAEPFTDISALSATAQFDEGFVRNRDLQAQLPFIRLTGAGDVNLLESTLDYRLQARVVGKPQFADGETLDDLEGLTIPVRLSGPIDSPGTTVDLKELLKSLAEGKAREKLREKLGLDEESGDDPSDPKEQLKKGLRDLFDR